MSDSLIEYGVSVRLAERGDIEGLQTLVQDTLLAMQRQGIPERHLADRDLRTELDAECDSGRLYLAWLTDRVLGGTFFLDECPDPAHAGLSFEGAATRALRLRSLLVPPRYQGQGLGLYLATWALEQTERLGFESLRLDVAKENRRAIQLFLGLRFREAGEFEVPQGTFVAFEKSALA